LFDLTNSWDAAYCVKAKIHYTSFPVERP